MRLSLQDVAATLAAMTPEPDRAWLVSIFRGFRSAETLRILWWLVQYDELIDNPAVLFFVVKLLEGYPAKSAADALAEASPGIAVTILGYFGRSGAREVLIQLDPERRERILRFHSDPLESQ